MRHQDGRAFRPVLSFSQIEAENRCELGAPVRD
jgi:hypothetical protein